MSYDTDLADILNDLILDQKKVISLQTRIMIEDNLTHKANGVAIAALNVDIDALAAKIDALNAKIDSILYKSLAITAR